MLSSLPVEDTSITFEADSPNTHSSENPIYHMVREHLVMCSLYCNISFLFQIKYVSLVQSFNRIVTHVVVLLLEIIWLALAKYAHKHPGRSEVKSLVKQGSAYYLQLLFIFSHNNRLIFQAWKLNI
jgi:hypothetical protein